MRLVAVLGYSARRVDALHSLCAERLRHAEQVAVATDAVLLSGWARRRNGAGEAELMRAAWNGEHGQLIADTTARTTAENAASVADTARRVGASEVTVVTSGWHAFRAQMLVRAALPGVAVQTSSPPGCAPFALRVRELCCLLALPYHLIRLRSAARGALPPAGHWWSDE